MESCDTLPEMSFVLLLIAILLQRHESNGEGGGNELRSVDEVEIKYLSIVKLTPDQIIFVPVNEAQILLLWLPAF